MRWITILVAAMAAMTGACSAEADCPAGAGPVATTIPVPRTGPYRKHLAGRLFKIQQRARQPADLLLLGDSILARWPDDALARTFPGVRVLDAALGGDKTQNLLWRIENTDWSAQQPKTIAVLIGTNNTAASSACDIHRGVMQIAKTLREKFPSAKVYVISLLPRGVNMLDRDELIRSTNLLIRQGQSAGRYTYINAHDAFYCGKQTPCDLMFGRNQVHLSSQGLDRLGGIMKQAMGTRRSDAF